MPLVWRAVQGHRWKVFGDERSRPPGVLTWLGKVILIPIGADVFWRRVWEWVVRKQRKNSFFTFKEFLYQYKNPRVKLRRRHRGKPHLPVEPPMIRRDDAGTTLHVAWFSFELVLARSEEHTSELQSL